ncbi:MULTISPECIES: DUF4199 domain-containing protein [unclassified Christiangramia]|jgi:uncharacterized protein YqgC (DUF456 family)|uniref:DUF4199 domain-containing protein n=1 Tax=unclassified Christiangramia TaxID=2615027 RepID=UPI002AC9B1E5|nr:DUF4199 domain-containing protein [Christiangramia sp. OXR-203]WPY97511.1 DUF4199 domain-containing protein [Christiangramia sp. OXR-203]
METPAKKISSSYGLYLGLSLILIAVLAYAFDLSLFTKWWFGISMLVFVIIMACMSTNKAKKVSTNLFSFKDAYGAYFLTVFIGTFISLVFGIILFNVIDSDAARTLNELTIESTVKMMEGFGSPESQINETVKQLQETNQFSIMNQLKGYGFQLIMYAVIGLIVALIFREKDKTNA